MEVGHTEIEYEGVQWIDISQDGGYYWLLVNRVKQIFAQNAVNFLSS
jgi:hypothetical protein